MAMLEVSQTVMETWKDCEQDLLAQVAWGVPKLIFLLLCPNTSQVATWSVCVRVL